jgi:cytoskeleton-associated protein 5
MTSSFNGHATSPSPTHDTDPGAQLAVILGRMTDMSTGHLHKEGVNELYLFLKNYPHMKEKADAKIADTGKAFAKYVQRALATRAAEDSDRNAAVAHTLTSQSKTRTFTF